ncbi:hypothetical protein AKJ09_00053 [Labilithrix luteola]|uniref:SHOCT domain-containing protein n=1 Tax=Labilithrix luteola TaxID=1391654 RepID=A0A0K1PJV2_9BACT|nr:hypothetical protein AKJ09_00053 [Labilithrix luteola]
MNTNGKTLDELRAMVARGLVTPEQFEARAARDATARELARRAFGGGQ